jgi:SAM-dependent methyltransferase
MEERVEFYKKIVQEQIKSKTASILVCGGGFLDKTVFEELGFQDVTISNLDTRIGANDYAPFKWRFENAEALSFEDASFDYVVIHAAIHHASVPHKLLTEMYRVAKIGLLAFESRDSLTMRILERFNMTQVYEHAAVYFNDCQFGGRNNTDIPNFVYRWTEREVEKTIQTYAPYFQHKFIYKYGTAFPCTPELESKGALKTVILTVARPFYWLFTKIFVKQQNLFAFYVGKPIPQVALFPWLRIDENGQIKFNKSWGDTKYKSQQDHLRQR